MSRVATGLRAVTTPELFRSSRVRQSQNVGAILRNKATKLFVLSIHKNGIHKIATFVVVASVAVRSAPAATPQGRAGPASRECEADSVSCSTGVVFSSQSPFSIQEDAAL
jgi:hypothetical protein